MEELYFSTNVGNDRTLCISPLTDALALAAGFPADQLGYFLYEKSHSEASENIAIIARLHSEEAVFRLRQMLGME